MSDQSTTIPRTTESYGTHIVLGDLAGLAVWGLLATVSSSDGLAPIPYFLAAPLVHGVHGHPGRAVGSLLLHVTAPVAGVLVALAIGASTCSDDTEWCELGAAAIGFGAGMIASTAIDAAVLAQDVPVASVSPRVAFTPTFSVGRTGGALAGIAGRF